MTHSLHCFTPYDIRGRIPDELDNELASLIGLALAEQFDMKKIVVGQDMRLSSSGMARAVIGALVDYGVDIVHLGLCGTEEVYHAVFSSRSEGVDGGIMVTASHNPADYNGMKLVQRGSRPVSSDSGLQAIKQKVADGGWRSAIRKVKVERKGQVVDRFEKISYIDHLLTYIDSEKMKPLKLVVNAGNGCAGPVIDQLEEFLPFQFIKMHHRPDGTFPNGVPNPLLPENREDTANAVRTHNADMGIAWDGDFDRCFLYDEKGRFIEGYYIVGLLARAMLKLAPGSTILHDPRLVWSTREIVQKMGGVPVMTRTGHAFIKEKMRECDAVYGGEMSAHHYFRDFGYCDSGMIPWLLVAQLISESGIGLSGMVNEYMAKYPVSGEINSLVNDPEQVLKKVEDKYQDGDIDFTDGVSISFPAYRFNLRMSNTEPVIRLNVETRGDATLLQKKTDELLALIR